MYDLKDAKGKILISGSSTYLYDFVMKNFGKWGDRYIEISVDHQRGSRRIRAA